MSKYALCQIDPNLQGHINRVSDRKDQQKPIRSELYRPFLPILRNWGNKIVVILVYSVRRKFCVSEKRKPDRQDACKEYLERAEVGELKYSPGTFQTKHRQNIYSSVFTRFE